MTDYQSLWQWSVDDPAAFWGALWEYFELGDRPDRVLGRRGDAGCAMVPRCAPELCRPDRAQRAHRPARDPARQRGRTDHRAVMARIARAHCGVRADTAVTRGERRAIASSATCPTSPRRSSRSWRPRASAPSGAPAGRTIPPRPRWTGSASSSRSSWSPPTAIGTAASPTTSAPTSPRCRPACRR